MTFGIRPDRPATEFGYIRKGGELAGHEGVFVVDSFVEKPDSARAEAYLRDGLLWNSGNFLARAETLLDEFQEHAPAVLAEIQKAVDGIRSDLNFLRLEEASFAAAPAISIDYAVMEKTRQAAVIPTDLRWSDIGSWSAVWDVLPKDGDGNVLDGDALAIDSQRNLIRSRHGLTAVVGVDDIVVVTTRDAVLVMRRDGAEAVKPLVEHLRARNRPEAIEHNVMYRPWGHYETVDRGSRYQVKKIVVEPGRKLSLQKHFHRSEHWIVVHGTALVTRDGAETLLRENESIYLPLGCTHRLENPGRIPLELIEVQSGSYLGEDDITRFEDNYNRV